VDAYLSERKGTDAALIFQNEEGTLWMHNHVLKLNCNDKSINSTIADYIFTD
jgi:hypothetical protein